MVGNTTGTGVGTGVKKSMDGWRLAGFPLFLSFNQTWSCLRLRVSVWEQLSKFIRDDEKVKDTPFSKLLKSACLVGAQR